MNINNAKNKIGMIIGIKLTLSVKIRIGGKMANTGNIKNILYIIRYTTLHLNNQLTQKQNLAISVS